MLVNSFDVRAFCQNLRATKPPYECPLPNCGRIYKTYSGIQFHLYNFVHGGSAPSKKSKRGRWHHRQNRRSPTPPPGLIPAAAREALTYAEAQVRSRHLCFYSTREERRVVAIRCSHRAPYLGDW